MAERIRIGIVGYGNLGRGVELSLARNPDMQLVGIFSRRPPASIQPLDAQTPIYQLADIQSFQDKVDVLILCGGSKSDLPEQGPELAKWFNTVDSFDTHNKIPEYMAAVEASAAAGKNVSVISVGWDPGLFSINRLYGEAILPEGETYTFWGKGLSQGHSDAIRRVPGVAGGVQYTLPVTAAIERVRSGECPTLTTREKHERECFVVLEDGADAQAVTDAIVNMPDYFADYNTRVNFISAEELASNHNTMPHGGFVIRSGKSDVASNQVIEFSLTLDSNPEFTSSVLVAYARAAYRLAAKGEYGARTVLDIAPAMLSPKSLAQLCKELL